MISNLSTSHKNSHRMIPSSFKPFPASPLDTVCVPRLHVKDRLSTRPPEAAPLTNASWEATKAVSVSGGAAHWGAEHVVKP